MTDFTEQFSKESEAEIAAGSSLSQELQTSMDEDQAKEDKRKSSRFEAAYEATDLPVVGPSKDKYDYEKDFVEGNTFKTDDGGGIQINNASYKPAAVNVAGRDLATGKQYTNQFTDPEGKIEQGIGKLQKEDHNTKAGSSYRNTYGLYDVARGIIDEDGSFDDFINSVDGPWSNDQLSMAYTSAKNTKNVLGDVDSLGRRYYDEMRDEYDQFEGRISNIPAEGYTEETLAKSEDWLKASREVLKLADPLLAAELSDEQLDSYSKSFMSDFRNNLPSMMYYADMAMKDETGNFAKQLLVMDEMYDALEISGSVAGRVASSMFSDVTNYITLGGGILVTGLGKEAVKEGIKFLLKRLTRGLAYDAAVGAGFGAEYENNMQNVEMAAGTRDEKDPAKIALMGGVEGAANLLIGGPLNVLTDKTLRGFAGANMKKGLGMLKENSKMTFRHPSGFKGQKGGIDFGPLGSDKVQLTFKMQDWLESTVKDGAKPTTIRQKIKEGVNKGIIKPEEVKWSGIEKFLTDAESRGGTGISKFRMIKIIEQETPQVKMVPVVKSSYMDYSLISKGKGGIASDYGIKEAGYRERMLVIPPARGTNPQSINPQSGIAAKPTDIGDNRYRPNHFTGPQHDQLQYGDDMIGHSRVENAELGGSKGKMVLEIQSDYHKSGQKGGYLEQGPKGDSYDLRSGNNDFNTIKFAKEHGIDPHDKNAGPRMYALMNKEQKALIDAELPKEQPYGKNWDAMGMRMEILDSINNGDEFIAWPANAEQINVIEQWGSGYENPGIVKRATETRVKAMKKLGLEVEQVDMPQYKGLGKRVPQEYDEINSILGNSNQRLEEVGDNQWELVSYPDGVDNPNSNREVLRELTESDIDGFVEELSLSSPGLQDSTFNVIRLTKEVKDKFLKEGMPAFSIGAMAIPEESKSERRKQKRGKDGKFK